MRRQYAKDKLEKDIQRAIKILLERMGWFALSTSRIKPLAGGDYGLPDLIAFRNGVTLLIEVKKPGGKIRPSQTRFGQMIERHLDPHLHYLVADDVEEVAQYINELTQALWR